MYSIHIYMCVYVLFFFNNKKSKKKKNDSTYFNIVITANRPNKVLVNKKENRPIAKKEMGNHLNLRHDSKAFNT